MKKIDNSSKLQVKSKIERQQRNVEYAVMNQPDNIEERIARREVKHQPPIIRTIEDLRRLKIDEKT